MNRKGFTLIELVMILALIGIIAAFVAPRLGNVPAMNAVAFTEKLRADIRYAQTLAVTRGKRTRVNFAPAVYAVTQDSSAAGNCSGAFPAVNDPAGNGTLSVILNAGSYTGITINYTRTCLEYDSLGKPYDCVVPPLGTCCTILSGMTITVIANGATSVGVVTVTAQTGAVN